MVKEFPLNRLRAIFLIFTCFLVIVPATSIAQDSKTNPANTPRSASGATESTRGRQYSGMYSFREEGEFAQITVEEDGKVNGYVSRYGEGGSEKGSFLEHYFRSGKLEGNKLEFTTAAVQGVSYEFKGLVERGDGKNPGDEAYYVLKGRLTETIAEPDKKVTNRSSEVVLKRFPEVASN